jgi:hypothetical protein
MAKRLLKINWEERAYTDWQFGMYPTRFEQWKRRCLIWQAIRFVVLSWKFKKTAAVNELPF